MPYIPAIKVIITLLIIFIGINILFLILNIETSDPYSSLTTAII